jgi:hypothetical protein
MRCKSWPLPGISYIRQSPYRTNPFALNPNPDLTRNRKLGIFPFRTGTRLAANSSVRIGSCLP